MTSRTLPTNPGRLNIMSNLHNTFTYLKSGSILRADFALSSRVPRLTLHCRPVFGVCLFSRVLGLTLHCGLECGVHPALSLILRSLSLHHCIEEESDSTVLSRVWSLNLYCFL
jgi:hypothetical protein